MLSFSDARGNCFNRLGAAAALVVNSKAFQDTQLTAMIDPSLGAASQFDDEPDVQAIVGDNYISVANGGAAGYGALAQQLSVATLNRMIFRDSPQLNQTLTSANTLASLRELIRQMKVAGASVRAQTVAAAVQPSPEAEGGNFIGQADGVIVASTRRPSDGLVLENAYQETVSLTCTRDSYRGGATAGNETFAVTGTGAQGDLFAFDWPLGSNASAALSAIDGSKDNRAGNLLTNSGFDAFTANVPDNWELVVGAAGTNVSQETSIVYGTGSSLAITGSAGNPLTEIRQRFGNTSGTRGSLLPVTQYSAAVWLRRDGVAPAAGQLTVELAGADNAVLLDAQGNACSFAVDLTALDTVYTGYTGVFRTPLEMPSPVYIRVRLSVALTSGRTVYLDRLGLGRMTQLGRHQCYFSTHSGSLPAVQGDYGQVEVTNSRGAGGTLATWQSMLFRLFYSDVFANEILFPSSATPTISDGLMT